MKIIIAGGTSGGGVGTINSQLIKILTERSGFEIEIVDKNDINHNTFVKYLVYYKRIINSILKYQPEAIIIQISETSFTYQAIALLFAKLINKKIVTIGYLHCHPIPTKISKILLNIYLSFINKLIVIDKTASKYLEKFKRNVHVFHLPNFIDYNEIKHYYKNYDGREHLVFIGRMLYEKGIFEILRIAQNIPEEKFVFIGDFKKKDSELENEFTKKINKLKNCIWMGECYGIEKYDIISKAKFFIFPTHAEMFPLTLIECGLLGVPAFITPVGSVPQIVKNDSTGVFISQSDTEVNVKKIKYYLNDYKKSKKMSDNCRLEFSSKYTRQKIEKGLIGFIKSEL